MNTSLASALHDPLRLAALGETGLLDSAPEESFDRLTRLAVRVLDVPTALVTLVDADRQFFKSFCGLNEPLATERETPLSHSFCQHVVHLAEPLIVENAREHPVVRDNPAIADFGVEAYAGMPLTTRDGRVLGSFCVLDGRPRHWSDDDIALLRDFAGSAVTEIELRREVERRRRSENLLRTEQKRLSTLVEAQFEIARAGLDVEWVLQASAERARELTGAAAAVVALVEGDEMVYRACAGIAAPHLALRRKITSSLSDLTVRTGQSFRCDDCEGDERVDPEAAGHIGARALLLVPLTHDTQTLGVLKVYSPEPMAFSDADVHMLRLLAGPVAAQLHIGQQFATIERLLAEQSRTETALRRSEQKFRSVFEEAAEGFFLVDREPDGTFRYVDANAAIQRITGINTEKMIGSTATDVLPPEAAARVSALYRRVFEGGASVSVEHTIILPRGAVTTRTRYHPLRDDSGSVVRVLGITEDFTERKQAEEALQERERHFRSLIENASDIITILDADGTIRYESPSVKTTLGYLPEELVERSIFEFIHPEDRPRIVEAIGLALEDPGEPIRYEKRFRHKDGSWHWLRGLGTNLLHDNAVRGLVANSRDVTAEKQAQAAREEYSSALERSNRELQEFAYVASHDLQEPLRKIRSFGDLLHNRYADALGEQGLEFLDWMRDAATRMQVLIDEVLAFSRVATHERPRTPVNLTQVTRQAVDDLEVRLSETGGRVEIGELPRIEADAGQMRQLFQNLIANALKFHRPGVPPVVAVRGAVTGGECRIEVEDDGIGFDTRFLDRIFSPFQRLHGRSDFEGSGMGLAICRRIVERHGGHITAHSTPGSGTTFVISLPVRQTGEKGDARSQEVIADEPSPISTPVPHRR